MHRPKNSVFWLAVGFLGLAVRVTPALAHQPLRVEVYAAAQTTATAPGISGQGKMRFKVLYTSDRLPEEARKVLVSAHGGFAVDHRPGREETYFSLPGAGILQIGRASCRERV